MKNFKRSILLIIFLNVGQRLIADNPLLIDQDKNSSVMANVIGLAGRVLKNSSDQIVFMQVNESGSADFFEISGKNGKILIKGNSGISMASGLNWYLKKFCNAQFTTIDQQLKLPNHLPVPKMSEKVTTPFRYRYFFNVCTFSYTMAWWGWEEWERQIDWMAMNGVNFPLAITGQEAVWYEVLKELGFNDQQIDDFLVGPAYLPWGWMGNIDGLGGPLPKSWILKHKELQQKIVQRVRAFGMTPILQGFTGHVPLSIKQLFPNVILHQTGDWLAGFGGTYFLDPKDELFKRIGKLFIEKQTQFYGTDHYYSADCFNEVNPDTYDPKFRANMSRSVYQSLEAADPQAVWVMQAWFLYYSLNDFWKEAQSKALISGVPNDKMIILDLYRELHPTWKKKSSFYGKPWIWNVLQNFGGRTAKSGKLTDMSMNLQEALNSPQKGNLSGIGMAMEYFGNNPAVEEFVMSRVWDNKVRDVKKWLSSYATKRFGVTNENVGKAWEGMLRTLYNTHKQIGTFLCERPVLCNPKLRIVPVRFPTMIRLF
jgi:alpha-N-acetylglucosaminidase